MSVVTLNRIHSSIICTANHSKMSRIPPLTKVQLLVLVLAQVGGIISTASAFVTPIRTRPHHQSHIPTYSTTATRSEESSSLAYELICGNVAWNTLIGEADRSLRLGIELERSGQARAASAALHEAATLYQCFVDSEEDFAHVTALLKEDCPAVLAYLCIRLGFLNMDALGDASAAVRLYKEAYKIDPVPSPFSYEGFAVALEASGGGKNLLPALEAYQKASRLDPSLKKTQFNMAVVLDRLGRTAEAEPIFEQIRRSESQYVTSCTRVQDLH
jgi:tetratricopeptide (TPR) repeat protein